MEEIVGKYTTAKVFAENIDAQTRGHLYQMVNNPAMNGKVRIMPDCHEGKGSVVGFTMPITDKVIPTTVGVDIGCGMLSFSIGKSLNHTVDEIDKAIRDVIPMGFNVRNSAIDKVDEDTINLAKKVGTDQVKLVNSLGTLGGGNHFIELGIADDNEFWFTIHSGSRKFGLDVCNYHQMMADTASLDDFQKQVEILKSKYAGKELGYKIAELRANSRPKGYLEKDEMYKYLIDMLVAQSYASLNRTWMMNQMLDVLYLK